MGPSSIQFMGFVSTVQIPRGTVHKEPPAWEDRHRTYPKAHSEMLALPNLCFALWEESRVTEEDQDIMLEGCAIRTQTAPNPGSVRLLLPSEAVFHPPPPVEWQYSLVSEYQSLDTQS